MVSIKGVTKVKRVAFFLGLLALAASPAVIWCGGWWWDLRQSERRVRNADHAALLATCRSMIRHLGPGPSDANDSVVFVKRGDPRLPKDIADLQPNFVSINRLAIHIELGGAGIHYGVNAVAEGASFEALKYIQVSYDCESLVPGLWYCKDRD